MANKATLPLPISPLEYEQLNESITRRQLEQIIQDLNAEITLLRTMQQSVTSRSVRRHQFLLKGAS